MSGKSPQLGICLLFLLISTFFGLIAYNDTGGQEPRRSQDSRQYTAPWPAKGNQIVQLTLPFYGRGFLYSITRVDRKE